MLYPRNSLLPIQDLDGDTDACLSRRKKEPAAPSFELRAALFFLAS